MSEQLHHASYSRQPKNQPDPAVRAGRTISSPQLWLTDGSDEASDAPDGRPDALGASRSFPILQPSPGDDVFGTPGSHPAMPGTYSLPRRKGISPAVYMASTVQSSQNYFPVSPRLERRIELKAFKRQFTFQAGTAQEEAMKIARKQAKLRRLQKHHKERLRDIRRRLHEGEMARRAVVSRQEALSLGFRIIAQEEADLSAQYAIRSVAPQTCYAPVNVRKSDVDRPRQRRPQIGRPSHNDHKAGTAFKRPARPAKASSRTPKTAYVGYRSIFLSPEDY